MLHVCMDKSRINKGLRLKCITLMKDFSLLTISHQMILTVMIGAHLTHIKDKTVL